MKIENNLLATLSFIFENQPTTIEEIKDSTGIHERMIYRYLDILKHYDLIKISKESHKSPRIITINWDYFIRYLPDRFK